ncbi:hypothetical protein D3C73_1458720 [compost metagenome]
MFERSQIDSRKGNQDAKGEHNEGLFDRDKKRNESDQGGHNEPTQRQVASSNQCAEELPGKHAVTAHRVDDTRGTRLTDQR